MNAPMEGSSLPDSLTGNVTGGFRGGMRALRIARVLLKHRLDGLLVDTSFGKWLWLLRPFTPRASDEDKMNSARSSSSSGRCCRPAAICCHPT